MISRHPRHPMRRARISPIVHGFPFPPPRDGGMGPPAFPTVPEVVVEPFAGGATFVRVVPFVPVEDVVSPVVLAVVVVGGGV